MLDIVEKLVFLL